VFAETMSYNTDKPV